MCSVQLAIDPKGSMWMALLVARSGYGGVQGSQAPACRPGHGVMRVFPLLKHYGCVGCEDSWVPAFPM